jgi:hypothetical protein
MSRDHLHPVTGRQSAGTWNSAANGRMSFPQVSRSEFRGRYRGTEAGLAAYEEHLDLAN